MHSVGPRSTLRSSPRTTFCLLTTCEQAHYISPHELVASSMAAKSARESQRRRGLSHDIKTRLRTSEIPIPLLVSSVVTHHCHHRPALPFRDWHPLIKPVLILMKNREQEDPLEEPCTSSSMGVLLLTHFLMREIVDRKPPWGGGFLSIRSASNYESPSVAGWGI